MSRPFGRQGRGVLHGSGLAPSHPSPSSVARSCRISSGHRRILTCNSIASLTVLIGCPPTDPGDSC